MKIPFKSFQPDIELLYKVLRREKTERPVLFEFLVNTDICRKAAGWDQMPEPGSNHHRPKKL